MSTLRVSTLQDTSGGNGSTPSQIANGIAKAWVNFNGTGTVAIRASYNVSSVTDNGTGKYTVNFTTALPDANYSAILAGHDATGDTNRLFKEVDTLTTTSFRLRYISANSILTDVVGAYAAIFR
jgi:hypothetical protein